MGGSIKWPYNDSECLDADFFKVASDWSDARMRDYDWLLQVVADHLVTSSGIRPLLHSFAVDVILEDNTIKVLLKEVPKVVIGDYDLSKSLMKSQLVRALELILEKAVLRVPA